ncbi:MAG TPA: magnesium chelatase subunit H [Methylibium sp.]|uniref:magnesium chelatase subunit H n=1 Tax=Methylibium sp. TaxID=2067992 RepID=UPI002DBE71D4|nr:magnesium chelatase subunit H [Methylibium sp.]HEU4457677.1 magnesium chelatase subunit H [Methylibium sp.]
MTPKRISAGEAARAGGTPMRVCIVTMDTHLASATERARAALAREAPGLKLSMHAASEWSADAQALERCVADIAVSDLVIVTMLFMEDHFLPVLPALQARREHCDAMVCAMSASEVAKLTRMGKFDMAKPASGPLALLKRLRGGAGKDGKPAASSGGAQQMRMLRRLPQLLRFIPGTAQDVRAYFLTLQYWLGGSEDNVANMVRFLVDRYAAGPRAALRGKLASQAPVEYPEVGVYHPRLASSLPARIGDDATKLPAVVPPAQRRGRIGLLLLRSYLLAGNTRHYDGVIAALEVQGLQVVPAFAAGLDARPAIERFFLNDGKASVDAVVSLTGFSLVGGPAYNDAHAAEEVLAKLDVPYLAAHPLEFQTLAAWRGSERGLLPVESTIMVAIPELDGATCPMVYAGRAGDGTPDMQMCSERTAMLAARTAKLVALRQRPRADRKIALVVFNFPPNAGNTGTAAHLAVFESLYATLERLRAEGYAIDLPESVDALRCTVLHGNAEKLGADANVLARIATDDHVRREKHLREIEAQWGPAPGRLLSDGRSIFVLGASFGQAVVTVQPGMGYEGDPMRLLFERGFAPTHAFSAFYRWLREDFKADAVLHFGTHGALEFMPGKQTGLSGDCWPDRLIADLPNFYLYASNNPSEGTIAKRRAGATLISYLTPPVAQAGLYRGLVDLKASLERWRTLEPQAHGERADLEALIATQAAELELRAAPPAQLVSQVAELEHALIPHGLHVVGRVPSAAQRADMLSAMLDPASEVDRGIDAATIDAVVAGRPIEGHDEARLTRLRELATVARQLAADSELDGIVHALDGRYMRPAPGGDLIRTPAVLPTGRNLHGFDPFRIPSAYALRDGARQAAKLLERHAADGHALPETVALVLWGTDNLKTEGAPLAQALALLGALPRFDSYGRLAGATLVPLAELGRPRIDVVMTLSGIFRDLMPLQIKLLAEACLLAAQADEPEHLNFVRKHALAYQREHGGDIECAALRVFGNAEGAYGANVNHLVDSGAWSEDDELAETYTRRKGFAYGVSGRPLAQPKLLNTVLAGVQVACQNLDSVELGVTTIDTYFDTLGGISKAVGRAQREQGRDAQLAVYIGDATRNGNEGGTVRTLAEQVALETRTRMLNPKWYEGMLAHGYEGVRQIEVHVTNTMGWSATTGQVAPWVYKQITDTFMLDAQMRDRLAKLNPTASVKVAQRLLEASQRKYWQPDDATLAALRNASDELEDRLEGVFEGATA